MPVDSMDYLNSMYLKPLLHLIFYMSMTLLFYQMYRILLHYMNPSYHNSMSMYSYMLVLNMLFDNMDYLSNCYLILLYRLILHIYMILFVYLMYHMPLLNMSSIHHKPIYMYNYKLVLNMFAHI